MASFSFFFFLFFLTNTIREIRVVKAIVLGQDPTILGKK